jgi:hypothetical protein
MCRRTNFGNQGEIDYRRRRCQGRSHHRRCDNLPTIHDTDYSPPRTASIEYIKQTNGSVEYSPPANAARPISLNSENPPAYQEHTPPKMSQDSHFAIVYQLNEKAIDAEKLGKHPGYIMVNYPLFKTDDSVLVVEMRLIQ